MLSDGQTSAENSRPQLYAMRSYENLSTYSDDLNSGQLA